MAVERWAWLSALGDRVTDELVLATYIGAPCFEWSALTNERAGNAMVGKMGNTVALAVGLALALPHRKVISFDGDGSIILELNVLALLGQEQPANLTVFVVDNGCYESIGVGPDGPRPTASAANVDLAAVAEACGVPYTATVDSLERFTIEVDRALAEGGCRFIVVKTEPAPSRVKPRNVDSRESKYRFVRHIEGLEGRTILQLARQGSRGEDPASPRPGSA